MKGEARQRAIPICLFPVFFDEKIKGKNEQGMNGHETVKPIGQPQPIGFCPHGREQKILCQQEYNGK